MSQAKISFIIPVYNESVVLQKSLIALRNIIDSDCEIIVVDGGSSDSSIAYAMQYTDYVFKTKKGRGIQLQSGAKKSNGEIIVLLHADTILPDDTLVQLRTACKSASWGRFNVKIDSNLFVFRIIEWMMNVRSCLSSIATGDQAIFMSRILLDKTGIPALTLMEDIELSRRLKKHKRCICIKSTVLTSARRWLENGIYKTILLMWYLRLAYYFGATPDYLASKYYAK